MDAQERIHNELLKARRIPPDLFVGSAETLAKLRNAIETSQRDFDASTPWQR